LTALAVLPMWETVDATLTVVPEARLGIHSNAIAVFNPDGESVWGELEVIDAATRPPNPVATIWAARSGVAGVQMFRSLAGAATGWTQVDWHRDEARVREVRVDSRGLLSDPPSGPLRFYRVSARNRAGHSGDLP